MNKNNDMRDAIQGSGYYTTPENNRVLNNA